MSPLHKRLIRADFAIAGCVLAVLSVPRPGAAGVAALWAVSDGEKVERDDRAHPLKARNAVWDGRTVHLAAARNEIVAFQVIVEADGGGVRALSAALPALRRRGGAEGIRYAPPAADPSLSAGRPIQLFSVHYLDVTAESHADWAWKPGSPAAPRDTTGAKPVQLVPEHARKGRGGFPVAVAPGLGQALWIEVYVRRDLPAGTYDGTLTVAADGKSMPVPVELRVFDFALPDANTLPVMVYYEPSQPELYHGRNLDDAYHRFAHRHRVELVHGYDEASVESHRGRFDGRDFTAAAGYEGPGDGVGQTIVPASFYGPGPAFQEKESAWKRSDAWMAFLARTLPRAVTFLYLPDEPYPAQYPEVRRLAENVRSNPGPGGKLPLFLTKRIIPEFQGLVDIWSIPPQAFDLAAAAAERAQGRRISFYNGGRPQGPTPVIDAPATEARAVAWAAFKHDVDLYFYWHGVHWQHNRQKPGERKQNVWANPITFDNRGQPGKPVDDQGYINGDGVLFYPGEEKVHPEEDRGIAGPVGTVQLANLRRGLQDHQYLTLARTLGLTAEVKEALGAVVPRVFSDAGETVGFAETGEAYEKARMALAAAIERRTARGAATAVVRPRLLVAEQDAFAGLPALRARWAAGERPTTDLAGLALSWLLSGDDAFARRALAELRADRPTGQKGSSRYVRYLNRALAFDWLYAHPGFDTAFKDAVAADLVAGAEQMLALPSLRDPGQASYHNHTVRELALAVFSLAAVEGHPPVEGRAAPLRAQAWRALDNVLEQTELVNPDGGYHESTDYMRITWAPLALMAEVRRTATGYDPATRWSVFRNMGPTYLYKVLPDGSEARDDDNEYPHLDTRDNVVLGYAVHRFKDRHAAWLLEQRGWLPAEWANPVLQFLWKDPAVAPRDPAATTEAELPRHRLFRGIGHLVLRDGWGESSTWIQLACGPYFAKHDHLDAAHLVVYHKGQLAIDAGADYTDTESPHYLNHYRRTVAHNTLLVYRPGETFFWGQNVWPAANDGGQRMDSSRFWNSVRSLEDWQRTRDLWDRCRLGPVDAEPAWRYARADATRAYDPAKLERFTREMVHLRAPNLLVVLDRVRAKDAAYRKAWLLHGVNEPRVVAPAAGVGVGHGGTGYADASLVTFEEGAGRLRVHTLLPRRREVVVRGGPGFEFWTPGDEKGGAWGSGQNWPLDPPEGGPLPADPYLNRMWKTFWDGIERLSPSNRRAVVPGAWRMEVSPAEAAAEDVFLHVLEIGDRDATPPRKVAAIEGHALAGAAIEGEAVVLFAVDDLTSAEATLPDGGTPMLLLAGLEPGATYEAQVTSGFAPGAPAWRATLTAGDEGTAAQAWTGVRDGRLRLRRIERGESR
jgi:hypothetical protein